MKIKNNLLILSIVLFMQGCASLGDADFLKSLLQLAGSVDQYNKAKSGSSSSAQQAKPSQEVKTLERPCQNLTDETVKFSNTLRSRYPDYNSNDRQACMFYKDFSNHLGYQKSRANSCDASGVYRRALDTRIGQYDDLLKEKSC